jgi:hypothetical protein
MFCFFFFLFLKDQQLAGMAASGRRRWRLKAAMTDPSSLLNWAMNWTLRLKSTDEAQNKAFFFFFFFLRRMKYMDSRETKRREKEELKKELGVNRSEGV